MPTHLSASQLREAIAISEEIEKLQARLDSILGSGSAPFAAEPGVAKKPRGKRTMSAAARARIAAAQKARWAKQKESAKPGAPKMPGRRKSGLTPEGRAKLAAAMKARWAAAKKTGGPSPTVKKR